MNADADADLPLRWGGGIAIAERSRGPDRAAHSLECAGKLDVEPISSGVDHLAAVPGEHRAQEAPVLFQEFKGEILVLLGQRAETDHVGEHDCGQTAFAHGALPMTQVRIVHQLASGWRIPPNHGLAYERCSGAAAPLERAL